MQESLDGGEEFYANTSFYKQFRCTVHKFFIFAIICSTFLLQETCMMTYAEHQRAQEGKLMSGPWYFISLIVGDTARFVFFVIIVIMLMRNDESQMAQSQAKQDEEGLEEFIHDRSQQDKSDDEDSQFIEIPQSEEYSDSKFGPTGSRFGP